MGQQYVIFANNLETGTNALKVWTRGNFSATLKSIRVLYSDEAGQLYEREDTPDTFGSIAVDANMANALALQEAEAKDRLVEVNAQVYADGKVTEAEEYLLEEAQAKANLAEVQAKAYADGIVTISEQYLIEEAQAKADLAEVQAKAYADGIVTDAEQYLIAEAQAKANLAEAQAKAYADGIVTDAEQAFITVAETKANLAEVQAKAYADGIVTDAEANAIAVAQAKANAAETAAKNYTEGWSDYGADKTQTQLNSGADISNAFIDGILASIIKNNAAAGATAYNDVEYWKYDATSIDGSKIYTGTITGNKINVVNLQAISAEVGTVTATWPGYVGFNNSSGSYRGRVQGGSVSLDIDAPYDIQLDASAGDVELRAGDNIELIAPVIAYGGIFRGQSTDVIGSSGSQWYATYQYRNYIANWWLVQDGSGHLHFGSSSSTKAVLQTNGDPSLGGELKENQSFTIDTEKYDKWELFNSLHSAYKTHDGSNLHEAFLYKEYEVDEFGNTGLYTNKIKTKDYIQILTECVFEMNEEIKELKNAADTR
jgi:hypothetical protein